ncbi:MAG: hypothetical protein ACP5SI_03135 [Chloroflexia bacterium]
MVPQARTILELEELVAALPPEDRAVFERIFHVSTTFGEVVPPETMFEWIARYFGSVDAVRRQKIVKVTNRVTLEGALYNELRSRRPIEAPRAESDIEATIESNRGDPFCRPLEGTPEDSFGRIRGSHSITASNIAKYDGFHGVIVFDEHHPLRFSREAIADYLRTGRRWAEAAHAADPEAVYYFFMWNCLWKSGASILHGHAQTTLSRGMPYPRVEALRQAALRYKTAYGRDYFADLLRAHRALGLSRAFGRAQAFAYLTPIKEKEFWVVGAGEDDDFVGALFAVLDAYVRRLGVRSFNLALYLHPLGEPAEDWSLFPGAVARVVDRGDPNSRTSDIGAMELYAASVISSDPFRVIEALG